MNKLALNLYVLLNIFSSLFSYENICDEFLHGVYIGNSKSAEYLLKQGLVDRVVCFGKLRLKHFQKNGIVKILKYDMSDSRNNNILMHFDSTCKFIDRRKTGVLIQCAKGHSRSASIAIAYLMKQYDMTFQQAYGYLKKYRPTVNPNRGFVRQLKKYEEKLWKKKRFIREKQQ